MLNPKVTIPSNKLADVNYLVQEVAFPVFIVGEDKAQVMRSTRFDCVKHNLEGGVYDILKLRDDRPYLVMIEDGDGNAMGDEKDDGEQKGGKSLISLIVGRSHRYHYKDDDVLNNLMTNFEKRGKRTKQYNWR